MNDHILLAIVWLCSCIDFETLDCLTGSFIYELFVKHLVWPMINHYTKLARMSYMTQCSSEGCTHLLIYNPQLRSNGTVGVRWVMDDKMQEQRLDSLIEGTLYLHQFSSVYLLHFVHIIHKQTRYSKSREVSK